MENIKRILRENWGISFVQIHEIHPRTWNIDEKYILKQSVNKDELEKSVNLTEKLLGQNIPVPRNIMTINKKPFSQDEGVYYVLMEKLNGINLENVFKGTHDYLDIAFKTGIFVAKLHKAFANIENDIELNNQSLIYEMKGWIKEKLEKYEWNYLSKEEFENELSELEDKTANLPKQPIHRDLHFGNLLFDNNDFCGYIDFDLSQRNIRIFDICYFLSGQLVDCVGDEDKINMWYDFSKSFILGYETETILLAEEKSALSVVLRSIEILFIAFFVNTNEIFSRGAYETFCLIQEKGFEFATK